MTEILPLEHDVRVALRQQIATRVFGVLRGNYLTALLETKGCIGTSRGLSERQLIQMSMALHNDTKALHELFGKRLWTIAGDLYKTDTNIANPSIPRVIPTTEAAHTNLAFVKGELASFSLSLPDTSHITDPIHTVLPGLLFESTGSDRAQRHLPLTNLKWFLQDYDFIPHRK